MSRCGDFYSWVGSGAPSYTNHGVSANLNIVGSLSIDAWVRLRQLSTDGDSGDILSRSVITGYRIGLDRNLVTAGKNTLYFKKGGVYNGYSTVDVAVGVLVHIAITYNSVTGDIIFYRNGISIQTLNNAAAILDSAGQITYIGSTTAGTGLNGCVYSLNVYNRVLSLAEVNYNKDHPQNPIRRSLQLGVHQETWQGGVWKDISPNAYDGTPTGVRLTPANNICGRCTVI